MVTPDVLFNLKGIHDYSESMADPYLHKIRVTKRIGIKISVSMLRVAPATRIRGPSGPNKHRSRLLPLKGVLSRPDGASVRFPYIWEFLHAQHGLNSIVLYVDRKLVPCYIYREYMGIFSHFLGELNSNTFFDAARAQSIHFPISHHSKVVQNGLGTSESGPISQLFSFETLVSTRHIDRPPLLNGGGENKGHQRLRLGLYSIQPSEVPQRI